jgi:acetyl-CoA carboxylase biotin carboxyl carrier protein
MKRYELTEFELQEEDFKIRLRRAEASTAAARGTSGPPFVVETPVGIGVGTPAAPPAPGTPPPFGHPAGPAPVVAVDEPGVQVIKSPMVGTFYRAASPDAKPFVAEGAMVTPETVVCIIEAMKLMNEIHAEVKGTVLAALVENGKSVEYGQPLFKVKVD